MTDVVYLPGGVEPPLSPSQMSEPPQPPPSHSLWVWLCSFRILLVIARAPGADPWPSSSVWGESLLFPAGCRSLLWV